MGRIPLAEDLGETALRHAVRREGWDLDLEGAERAEGWENVALVSPEWIVRFPRDDDLDFDTELEVLRLVDGRLPVPTPRVSHVGRLTRCLAYRRLDGHPWSREAYVAATDGQRDALSTSCAAALAAMHDLLEERPARTPSLQPTSGPSWLADLDGALSERVRGMVEELQQRWRTAAEREIVLLHNDFHLQNAVQAEPVGALAGLWDFSCVAVGPPEIDLRYLEGSLVGPWTGAIDLQGLTAHDHLNRVAAAYTAATDRGLDMQLAILANRLENLEDLGPEQVARCFEVWDAVSRIG